MIRVCFFAALLSCPSACVLAGNPSPPLSPQDARDGWIALYDGETTFGWHVDGAATVEKGLLILGGTEKTRAFTTAAFAQDYHLYYEIKGTGEKNTFHVQGTSGFGYGGGVSPGTWHERLVKCYRKNGQHFADYFVLGQKGWESVGGSAAVDMGKPSTPHQVFIHVPPGNTVAVRNLKIRPMHAKPLFNGTDLKGWNVFPGKKSTFAVVDGAINVKDGPGDLQTTGKYGDFLLQLECISNGTHLNSGVFFRCRDGEYQNGYEAQVRNQFTQEPTQKYSLEEYDSKTNKLLGKKEAMSSAVDFGTGAIYRRVPARKQMSKDGEWFTMTVLAHGNHLATWVNGIQVVDWYDHRPKSDNARTGCRLEAGHISFQGHDPTTDLSFRNIRIQEYPEGK